jgi:hypothetical protein
MPCEYRTVRIRSRRRNRNRANQKKKAIIKALIGLGFDVGLKKAGKRRLFILGKKSDGNMEILFDERSGKFVVHFEGVATHEKEHEIFDQLAAKLKEDGYDASSEEYKDSSKLPESGGSLRDKPIGEEGS